MTLVALTTHDRLVADLQAQLVDGLGGHQADDPVRPGDDLDDGGDAVVLDPGDDAREPVAGRLGDDRPVGRRLAAARRGGG